MTVYDQAHELKENLPAYLTQAYEPGYEVIVVDETSTDDTSEILKLYKQEYPILYTTFLPKQLNNQIRRKMAINLGIKASKNDWLILHDINNKLKDETELQTIVEALNEDAELTFGYISKKGIRLQPFYDVDDARKHILRLERRLKKIREFKRGNYAWGRYDFIIVKKEFAYELLSHFEQSVSATHLFGIRLSILWKNLVRRPSTTLLVTSPTDS